jgi:predicted Zn-dependent protease
MKKNLRFILYLAVILLFLSSMLSSCARNPVTGKQEFMLLSESDEIKMGKEADGSVVQMYGIYQDENLANYINDMGQKMAKISHRPQLNYEFKVMDSPVINAFAVPGGYVYLTRGILAHLNNEAELAGVVGHEIGHVTARHSAQKYSETYITSIGLGVGSMVSKDFAMFAGLAAQGLGLLFLKFSRDDERQSDVLGVDYSTQVGYDAREMANFFNTLDKMQSKSEQGGLPDWFSTHPDPADRVVDVRKEAERKQAELGKKDLAINRDKYLGAINGLVFGENPRQGFVEKNVFYHPDLKFKFPVPAGWKINNLPTQVQMIDAKEKGIILFTLAGTSSAKTAADQFVEKTKSKVAKNEEIKVNGLKTRKVFSEIADKSNVLRIQSYFIEMSGEVYVFHGFSSSTEFDNYQSTYTKTMTGFNRLKEKAKLNVKPDRVKVVNVNKVGTFKQVLTNFKVSEKEQQDIALLNGINLNDQVKVNTQIKLINKGK